MDKYILCIIPGILILFWLGCYFVERIKKIYELIDSKDPQVHDQAVRSIFISMAVALVALVGLALVAVIAFGILLAR